MATDGKFTNVEYEPLSEATTIPNQGKVNRVAVSYTLLAISVVLNIFFVVWGTEGLVETHLSYETGFETDLGNGHAIDQSVCRAKRSKQGQSDRQ
jgi:hypothetical protein